MATSTPSAFQQDDGIRMVLVMYSIWKLAGHHWLLHVLRSTIKRSISQLCLFDRRVQPTAWDLAEPPFCLAFFPGTEAKPSHEMEHARADDPETSATLCFAGIVKVSTHTDFTDASSDAFKSSHNQC